MVLYKRSISNSRRLYLKAKRPFGLFLTLITQSLINEEDLNLLTDHWS